MTCVEKAVKFGLESFYVLDLLHLSSPVNIIQATAMPPLLERLRINQADRAKTHDRNNSVEYFSAAAEIPVPNNMNVRCLSEFQLDIPIAGEICAAEIFWDRVFTRSARNTLRADSPRQGR
jgi:hypothetical protein